MSKGRKRRSAKQVERDYKAASPSSRPEVAPVPKKPWLTMSDDEIDKAYWNVGQADRTRMKKEAQQERLRLEVQKVLEQEKRDAKT